MSPVGPWFTGNYACVEFGLQQIVADTSWGQDIGDKVALAPSVGGVSQGENMSHNPIEIIGIQERFYVNGVKYFTGTIKFPMSYAYLERLIWAVMGLDSYAVTGAAEPWTHTFTPDDQNDYIGLNLYRTDQAGNAAFFGHTNVSVTSVSINTDYGGETVLEAGVIGKWPGDTPTVGTLPTIMVPEPMKWSELSVVLDGNSDPTYNSIGLSLERGVQEGNGAINTDDPATDIVAQGSESALSVKLNVEAHNDAGSGIDLLLRGGAVLEAANTLTWSDGGDPAHTFTVTFGKLVCEAVSDDLGDFGEQMRSASLHAYRTAALDVVTLEFENAIEEVLRVTP